MKSRWGDEGWFQYFVACSVNYFGTMEREAAYMLTVFPQGPLFLLK